MMIDIFNYVTQFIIGGALFTTLYHFAHMSNEKYMAIIIALPIRICVSYIYSNFTSANLEKIYKNSAITILVTLFLVLLTYSLLYNKVNQHVAFFIGILFWFICIFLSSKYLLV